MRCLLCRKFSKEKLCSKHNRIYVYDHLNKWFRKKKRFPKGVRRREDSRKYHSTERKLGVIFKLIFGKDNVISAVHPEWADNPDTGALLEYDYGIINKKLFVEYNGIQHYEFPNYFHKSKREFELQKIRDRLKMRLADENNWKLIIIDYKTKVTYGVIFEELKLRGII